MEKQKLESVSGNDIVNALLSFLFVIIVNLFIMPIKLWIRSVKALSEIKEKGLMNYASETNFPVLFWVRLIFDSLIFFAWPIILLFALIRFFQSFGLFSYGFNMWLMVGLAPLVVAYLLPVFIAIIKELFNLSLIQVMKIEKIEENTRK